MNNKEYYVYIIEQYGDSYCKKRCIDKTSEKNIALEILSDAQKRYGLTGFVQEY